MSGRLAGKVAMITGAASGIGKRTAERFVAECAKVLLTDIQDAKGEEVAKALWAVRPPIANRHADVTREEDIAMAVAEAGRRFGPLDILLSNAGIRGQGAVSIDQLDMAAWDRAMNVLPRSVVYSTAKGAVVHFHQGAGARAG